MPRLPNSFIFFLVPEKLAKATKDPHRHDAHRGIKAQIFRDKR